MKFDTIEQYIIERGYWRENYNNLSIRLRELKEDIRTGARAGNYVGELQYKLILDKQTATAALETRKQSKIKAAALWLEAKK